MQHAFLFGYNVHKPGKVGHDRVISIIFSRVYTFQAVGYLDFLQSRSISILYGRSAIKININTTSFNSYQAVSPRNRCLRILGLLTGMNCEICHLKELEVEVFQVREVLRCILHTILFHRALGLVRPKDVDSEHFEITYVQCGDAELEKKIEEKIDHFYGWVEKHPNKNGQVLLSFYEVKNKQASWFTNKVERLYWEQWYINLHIVQPIVYSKSHSAKTALNLGGNNKEESGSRHASLETSLREVLFQIIKFVNEKKDHIPPVPNLECVSFPYEITVPSHSDSSFGVEILKRMLQTGHPTMLS